MRIGEVGEVQASNNPKTIKNKGGYLSHLYLILLPTLPLNNITLNISSQTI